jgi:hypothetical protein
VRGRSGVLVIDDGPRGVEGAPATHPGAPGEVDVVEAEEERGVEAADGDQHLAPVERRAAVGSEDLGRFALARVEGLAEQTFGADAEPVDHDPGRVDGVGRLSEAHLRRDRSGRRIALADLQQLGDPLGSIVASLLSMRIQRPRDRSRPTRIAAAKPMFSGSSMTSTPPSRSSRSAEPSPDPLSITISSLPPSTSARAAPSDLTHASVRPGRR